MKICWGCLSPNRFTRQQISKKLNLNTRKIQGCKGSGKVKFGEVKDIKFIAPEVSAASTYIKPPTTTNYDFDASGVEDDIANFNNYQCVENVDFGFSKNSADLSTKIPISEETIPSYEELKKTASIFYKHCIICLKQDEPGSHDVMTWISENTPMTAN